MGFHSHVAAEVRAGKDGSSIQDAAQCHPAVSQLKDTYSSMPPASILEAFRFCWAKNTERVETRVNLAMGLCDAINDALEALNKMNLKARF